MSENKQDEDAGAPKPVDHVDTDATILLDYFSKVGASMECPSCKKSSWDLEVGPDAEHKAAIRFEARAADGTVDENSKVSFIPVFVLTCINCGFMRFHRRAAVSKWQMTQSESKK